MDKYLHIENSDGKVWLLPECELKTALCLYQPSSTKGKLLKKGLPFLNRLSYLNRSVEFVYSRIGLRHTSYSVQKDVEHYLQTLYGSNSIRYALFLGTPSVHQKTTIQIFSKGKIYGYCKISDSVEIYNIFKHEQQVLDFLHYHGINNVPQCISCKEIMGGMYSFVQTTTKTNKSTVHHELSDQEVIFLSNVAEKTAVNKAFEDTDFYRSVHELENSLSVLEKNGYDICSLCKALKQVKEYYKKQCLYCVCHRDFTPWNMFYNATQLFVFDFEYAGFEYPPYLDAIHYIVQTAIFEKRLKVESILCKFKEVCEKGVLKGKFQNYKMAFLAYLVDIISLYVNREKNNFSGDVKKSMDIWMGLCKKIVNE